MPKSEVSRRRASRRSIPVTGTKKAPHMGCFLHGIAPFFWQLTIANGGGVWYNDAKTAKGGICCEKQVF